MKRVLIVLGVALAAVLAVGGYALGSTSKPKVDTACVNSSHKVEGLFARAGSCPLGQHKVVWNQQGPRGPRGPAGPGAESNVPASAAILGSGINSVTAKCPASEPHVISGGYTFSLNGAPITSAPQVIENAPVDTNPKVPGANAWTVAVPPVSTPPPGTPQTELAVSIICSK